MYNFDVERFKKMTAGALAQRKNIEKCADEISKKGFKNIFLIGVGGSIAHMYPLEYILKTNSKIDVYAEIASEFVLMNHQHFGPDSVCIFTSRSGDTKETVAAAKFCKEKGATTIALVAKLGTSLANICDYVFDNFAEDDNLAESLYLQQFPLIFRLMHNNGEFPEYDKFIKELETMPEQLLKAKESMEDRARAFADYHKETPYHILVGSGIMWGDTYNYAMCILEEMQWIRTKSIHAAEFFHGTLEVVEEDTSVILLYTEDETRPLMDRVKNFVTNISKEVTIIDTKELELPTISEEFRKYMAIIVMNTMLERISIHLERARNHPLSTRRYYRQMEY